MPRVGDFSSFTLESSKIRVRTSVQCVLLGKPTFIPQQGSGNRGGAGFTDTEGVALASNDHDHLIPALGQASR